jgi:hypothetical protein
MAGHDPKEIISVLNDQLQNWVTKMFMSGLKLHEDKPLADQLMTEAQEHRAHAVQAISDLFDAKLGAQIKAAMDESKPTQLR